jgi:hypothetical protein
MMKLLASMTDLVRLMNTHESSASIPSRKRRPDPTQRYGVAHKALRKRLAPVVAGGTVRCARCDELIAQDENWELDHRDDGNGWLGPSHRSCNRSAGWEKMVASNGNGQALLEAPYRWSRRWCDEPPVGTEVFLGNGLVEVHVGRGIWQTVAT